MQEDEYTRILGTPLLDNSENISAREKRFENLGAVVTKLAMVGQGVFGGLLIVDLVKHTGKAYVPLAAGLGVPVTFSAYRAKELLVFFFARQQWRELGSRKKIDLLNLIRWQKVGEQTLNNKINFSLGVLDLILTVNVAAIFAGLTRVSFADKIGAADLALKIGHEPFTWLGKNLFPHIGFQAPFILSAFIANMLSFPNVHRGAEASLRTLSKDFVDLFRDTGRADLDIEIINALSRYLIGVINDDDKFKQCLQALGLLDESIAVTRTSVLGYSQILPVSNIPVITLGDESLHLQPIPVRSSIEKRTTFTIGLVASAITAFGFVNYISMPEVINSTLPDSWQMNETFLKVVDYTTFISLLALAVSVYTPARDLASKMLFKRETPSLSYTDKWHENYDKAFAVVLCAISAMPNVYQAMLAKEDYYTIAASLLAPLFLELPAVVFRYVEQRKEKAFVANETVRYADNACTLMAKLRDGENLDIQDTEQLREQYGAFSRIP